MDRCEEILLEITTVLTFEIVLEIQWFPHRAKGPLWLNTAKLSFASMWEQLNLQYNLYRCNAIVVSIQCRCQGFLVCNSLCISYVRISLEVFNAIIQSCTSNLLTFYAPYVVGSLQEIFKQEKALTTGNVNINSEFLHLMNDLKIQATETVSLYIDMLMLL
jgi:hypothetical protein